jgi:two-component sensor histidine kinase
MDLRTAPDPEVAVTERLAALAEYGILDTRPESGFDDIVLLATRICEAPVGLVSLVAADRQWFKARIGFPACETPLSQSVCAHALRETGILVIPDLTQDERTRHNALVTDAPFIRFYAGAVLETPDGVAIGTLCVIDTVPRPEGLTPMQADSLQALARQVMTQMELGRLVQERERALVKAAQADTLFREQQEILRDERQHRIKNIISMVQAIVLQTLRYSDGIDAARDAVSMRLRALAKGQELLFLESAEQTALEAIVASVAAFFGTKDHVFDVAGPHVDIGSKGALAFSLILNELATNAAKYGALSGAHGAIAIHWGVEARDGGDVLTLSWREAGGPPVEPPQRRGFGSVLIEKAIAGGTTDLRYCPGGVECDVAVPVARLHDA